MPPALWAGHKNTAVSVKITKVNSLIVWQRFGVFKNWFVN